MMRQYKNRTIIIALFLLIVFGLCTVFVSFAGEKGKDSITVTNPQIKVIPVIDDDTVGEKDFEGDIEKLYDFIGTVDDAQRDFIVVDDSLKKIAPGASISGARKGARVGLVLNSEGEVVRCEPVKKVRR